MTQIRIAAAPGRRVRNPANGRVLPNDGIVVSGTDIFWRKALKHGDVVLVPAPAASPQPQAAAPQAPATQPAQPAAPAAAPAQPTAPVTGAPPKQ